MKKIALFLIFFLPLQLALAQVDTGSFSVRTFIIDDFIPPSTPTLLSAVPIAPIQIDLSWSSSTDNYAVSGYSVSRDGTPIATTTLTSYSDTGLTASTTYSYSVRAFDVALNYSTSSNSLSTTTPDNPVVVVPVEPESNPVESTVARVVLNDFQIIPGVSTTSIKANSSFPARLELRWGKSTSYELGYVVREAYTKSHNVLLTDLEPGTTYEYQIIGYTPSGHQTVVKNGQFTTLSKALVLPPVNVSRFLAEATGENVKLSWKIPEGDNISYVRILRSYIGFPAHPQDGAIVYQGTGSSVLDENILSQYSPIYYTAFVVDNYGNVSSGAVTIVFADSSSVTGEIGGYPSGVNNPIGKPIITEEATSSVVVERVTPDMKMPELGQIFIEQGEQNYSLIDTDIVLTSDRTFKISIPQKTIAGNLKSIIVTLLDPTDNRQQYSFLLRINKDQSAYEAMVSSLGVVGKSRLIIEIYDYEALVVAKYQGPISFVGPMVESGEVVFPDMLFRPSKIVLFSVVFFLLLIILIIIYVIYRRQGEDKE